MLQTEMASKRKSPPTKLQELVELVPLCEASVNALFGSAKVRPLKK